MPGKRFSMMLAAYQAVMAGQRVGIVRWNHLTQKCEWSSIELNKEKNKMIQSLPLSPKQRRYGFIPDQKDHRDLVVRDLVAPPPKLPAMINLEQFLGPVKDQGDLGSCTGHAFSEVREFLAKKYEKKVVRLSPLYIYYKERLLEGTVTEDAGAEPRDGCRVLVMSGVCDEEHDPYLTQNMSQAPTEQMDEDAAEFKIGAYHRARNNDEIKTGLASGYCPTIGFDVYSGFESDAITQSGELAMPNYGEQPVGGHEVLCYGYDDNHVNLDRTRGAFMIRNSWGSDWGTATTAGGTRGNFWMPYNYMSNYASDVWFVHLGKPWKPIKKS